MASDEQNVSSTTDPISVLTISPHSTVDLADIKGDENEDAESMAVGSGALLTNQNFLSVGKVEHFLFTLYLTDPSLVRHVRTQLEKEKMVELTLSQKTNFTLFQIERVCRRQFQIW